MDAGLQRRVPFAAYALLAIVSLYLALQLAIIFPRVWAMSTGGSPSAGLLIDAESDRVGATAAEFRVDEAGAATYSIPLYGVPGTAGVAPKLALTYSSQGPYGPAGKGWSISGQSSITRCRMTREAGDAIVSGQAGDPVPAPVNFSATDRYCLDGQRLIPAQRTSSVCPAVGGMTVESLATEIESFQRVCAYAPIGGTAGVSFFTVDRKDGSKSWFGDRDNDVSANRPDGYFNSTSPGREGFALSWAQTRLQDSTGNYVDWIYLENPGGTGLGEHLLSEVRYTGKTVLPGQPGSALTPYARLILRYADRGATQWSRGYVAGGVVAQTRRLEAVVSCASNGGGDCPVADQARFYQLAYGPSPSGNGLETLESVQECRDSGKGICLAPTKFTWSAARHEFATQESLGGLPTGSLVKFEGFKTGDVDGDGRQDIVYLKDGANGDECPTEYIYVLYAVSKPDGTPFEQGDRICTPAEIGGNPGRGEGAWQLLDYNGDGRDDLFVSGPIGTGWRVYLSQGRGGNGNFIPSDVIANLSPAIPSTDEPQGQPQLADLNGDGLLDVIYARDYALMGRLMERGPSGFGWGPERSVLVDKASLGPPDPACAAEGYSDCDNYAEGTPTQKTGFSQLADFDGDGASDLLMAEVTSGTKPPPPDCQLEGQPRSATGSDTFPASPAGMADSNSTEENQEPAGVGCEEVVFRSFKTRALRVQSLSASAVTLAAYGSGVPGKPQAISVADANGDGLSDLFFRAAGSTTAPWQYAINTGAGFQPSVTLPTTRWENLVRFVDANGDGRSDVLRVVDAGAVKHYVALFALPGGGFETNEAPVPGYRAFLCEGYGCDERVKVPMFTDIDGDGGLDFMSLKLSDNADLYLSRASQRFLPRDTITAVENGLGAVTEIGYSALTNGAVYRRESGSRNSAAWGRGSPVADLLSPMYVVSSASSSSPQDGNTGSKATLYYRYAGAKVQAGGRGFLGFKEIVTIDPNQSGGYVTTQTIYRQDFPFVGMPQATDKRASPGATYPVSPCLTAPNQQTCFSQPGLAFDGPAGSLFSQAAQIWEADSDFETAANVGFNPGVQAPVHVRTAGTEERSRDHSTGEYTSRALTAFAYGASGNTTSTSVETYTGLTEHVSTVTTQNQYAQDSPSLWRLGRLTGSTVTHARPGRPNVVRTSAFAYSMSGAATGLLLEERSQVGGGIDQELIKRYQLDEFGNRTKTSVCNVQVPDCGVTAHEMRPSFTQLVHRISRVAYDSRGRYPIATYEPFGDASTEYATQQVLARDIFGGVTDALDLNGVRTQASPGAFGRAYNTWTQTVAGVGPRAVGGGVESWTTYQWCGGSPGDCPAGARFRQRVAAVGSPTQWIYFDILGRPIFKAAETFNAGVSGKDVSAVCTTYDVSGKAKRVSSPFFLTGLKGPDGPTSLTGVCQEAGRYWTTTGYDVLGRVVTVSRPDGVSRNNYVGLATESINARQKSTWTTVNGKGEVVRVGDARGLQTHYTYEADGSLSKVSRDAGRGSIDHVFTFDALGRKVTQNDPDSGFLKFTYNALGEVLTQEDGAGNVVGSLIDGRGRPYWRWTRTPGVDSTSTKPGAIEESYVSYSYDLAPTGIGKIASEQIGGNYVAYASIPGQALSFSRHYRYDTLGRPNNTATIIDGVRYPGVVEYDALGRPWKTQDATFLWTKTVYSTRGMPEASCKSTEPDTAASCPATADTYVRNLQTDAWGNVVRERRGNNAAMDVATTYKADTGRVERICAGNEVSCNLVNEAYLWDGNGNLTSHQKENRYLESFDYDNLDRLMQARTVVQNGVTSNAVTQQFAYDDVGNICQKTALGVTLTYEYTGRGGCGNWGVPGSAGPGAVGPHQVYKAGDASYYYDARGNQTIKDAPGTAQDRQIDYSIDNRAYQFRLGGSGSPYVSRFWYAPDGARYKVTHVDIGQTMHYVGNVEVTRNSDGSVIYLRYLPGGVLQSVVGDTIAGTHTTSDRYQFKDHLGSLVRLTDANGTVVSSADYAAFGERRSYTDPNAAGAATGTTRRGFTGHEHFMRMSIIHMNARVFDTNLGRFLQPDPVIQAPMNSQGWNAYTYVFNNPLANTDPTGMISQSVRQWGAVAFAVVYAYFTYDFDGAAKIIAAAAVGGAIAGGIATGSWKGAVYGAFSGALTAGIGGLVAGADLTTQIAARAVTGGVLESIQGGNFGHGFVSAGVTAGFMPQIGKIGSAFARAAIGALLGGTVSAATGGKFANGAATGAVMAALMGAPSTGSRSGQGESAGVDETEATSLANQRLAAAGKKAFQVAAGGMAEAEAFKSSATAWAPDSYRTGRESNWYVVEMSDGSFGYTYPSVGAVGGVEVPLLSDPKSLVGRSFGSLTVKRAVAVGHNHLKGDVQLSGVDGRLSQNSNYRQTPIYLWNETGQATYINSSMTRGRLLSTYPGARAAGYDIPVTW